ncbi:hypothetical protein PMAYCL1PPCAC_10624, partial [Pristionchus mayeri]
DHCEIEGNCDGFGSSTNGEHIDIVFVIDTLSTRIEQFITYNESGAYSNSFETYRIMTNDLFSI